MHENFVNMTFPPCPMGVIIIIVVICDIITKNGYFVKAISLYKVTNL